MWFSLYWSWVDLPCFTSLVAQLVKNPHAMWEIWVQLLGWEDTPGEGKGYPLQYSGLENSVDCTVYGVKMNWTRLSNFHFLSFWIDNFRPFTNFGQYFFKYLSGRLRFSVTPIMSISSLSFCCTFIFYNFFCFHVLHSLSFFWSTFHFTTFLVSGFYSVINSSTYWVLNFRLS